MNLGQGITVAGALVSLGGGGYTAWAALKAGQKRGAVIVSHSGRDQALVQLLQGARRSISVRTECLTLTPIGNELAQAFQRGVSVRVELPLQAGTSAAESRLPRILMELGVQVTFRSDPAWNYRGAYLEVDGRTFFYSAAPLAPNGQGALVSYVTGPLGGLDEYGGGRDGLGAVDQESGGGGQRVGGEPAVSGNHFPTGGRAFRVLEAMERAGDGLHRRVPGGRRCGLRHVRAGVGQAESLGKVSGGMAVVGGLGLVVGGAGGAIDPLNTKGWRGRCVVSWVV